MMLPKVNRPLYESAQFKPSPLIVIGIGLFSAAVMLIFMVAILKAVFVWTILWLAVGSALFFVGRQQRRAAGFEYEAHLARDLLTGE